MNKNKKIILLIGIIASVLLLCCSGIVGGFILLNQIEYVDPSELNNNTNDEIIDIPEQTDLDTEIPQFSDNSSTIKTNVESIFNNNLTFKKTSQVNVSEMYFFADIVDILVENNWDGDPDSTLPILINDFTQEQLDLYYSIENNREDKFTIPLEEEKYYISEESEEQINRLIPIIRQEFLDYIEAKGVNQKYITEFETRTFPNDSERYEYYPINDPDSPTTAVQGFRDDNGSVSDFSKLELKVYPTNIYIYVDELSKSGILGEKPQKESEFEKYYLTLRDMSLRLVLYHEFTHVLQKSVDTVNAPEKYKEVKSSWLNSTKPMYKADDRYFWSWGSSNFGSDMYNRDISSESQAEGVAFEILTEVYDMSTVQKELVWEFVFGRLTDAKNKYDYFMEKMNTNFPGYNPAELNTQLENDFIYNLPSNNQYRTHFKDMSSRLDAISSYGGYFHPMRPENSYILWSYLEH